MASTIPSLVHGPQIDLVFHFFGVIFSLIVWALTFKGSLLPGKILLSIKGGFKGTLYLYLFVLLLMGCSYLASGFFSGKIQNAALFQESVAIPLGFLTSVAVLVVRVIAFNFMGNAFKDNQLDSPATLILGVVLLSLTYIMYVEEALALFFWLVSL